MLLFGLQTIGMVSLVSYLCQLLNGTTLLLSVGLSILTTRWLIQPILQLSATARRLAQGEFNPRIANNLPNELGQGFRAFDDILLEQENNSDRRQAAEVLLQSEAVNRAICEALPDLIVRMRADGTYLDIKPAKTFPLIQPVSIFQGANVRDILPPAEAERRLSTAKQALQTAEIQIYETPLRINEKLYWQEVRIVPLTVDQVLVVIRDITDRKQAEEALRQSEERNRAILSAIPDLITIVSIDGIYLDSIGNNAAINLIPDTIDPVGKHIRDLIPPELAERKLQAIRTAIITREIQAYEQKVWIGDKLQYEELRIVPYGQETALLIIRDITERKRAEEALRKSEERWHLAIQGSHDGIWDQNLITNKHFLSPRCLEMLGYTPDELRELDSYDQWMNHVHPHDRDRMQSRFQQHLDRELPFYTCEYRMRCKDGTYKWLLARGHAHWNEQGQPVRAVGSLTDITDMKHAEEELRLAKEAAETASRAKSTFLANMSHELRTPLTAILGFTQLISHDRNLTKLQQEYLDVINRNGEYLLQLINDVLSISKIEAGRVSLEEHSFDLFALLDTLEGIFRLQAETKGLRFICDRCPPLPQFIHTDERKLRQILTNLLDNAIKFTQTGHVTLRVSSPPPPAPSLPLCPSPPPSPTHLTFAIQDTGVGIATDELHTIFDAFVQSESGRKSLHGTGLGLAISRHFVQLMGGEITVNSQVNQGTLFQVHLPLKPASPSLVQSNLAPQRIVKLAPDQPIYRVLVADDTEANRHLLVQLLSAVGFEVREACDGQEALEQWFRFSPHLMWIDMRMPVMDGFETVRQIRQHERNSLTSTKIIAITAAVFEEEQQRMRAVGCDQVISKPCAGSVIFDTMAQHLGVQYLYEERLKNNAVRQEKAVSQGKKLSTRRSGLEVKDTVQSALAGMSAEWVAQLNHAARRANEREIFQLLEAIPDSRQALKEAIVHLIQNFQLDQLIQLTQIPSL
jgi:PAS domain S-box-containing protein